MILNPADLPEGIDDSKVLTAERREALEIEIKARALAWGVGFASVEEIAELNILHATGLAMCRAIEAMAVQPAAALVDGNYRFKLPCDVQTVVGGDGLSLSIAAASILAKTARDRLMVAMAKALKARGFNFCGPVIVYAFMQAVGMVNDHVTPCFRHGEVRDMARP